MKSRSTEKLTATFRIAALAAALACAVVFAGCASNASRHWAQTAPVIAPSDGATLVSLGAFEPES